MKIQSGLLTNGSGSVGGMTVAKNRGGLYLRSRSAVSNPQTPGQTLIRTSLAAMATIWRTLTEEQRDGWRGYAVTAPRTNWVGDPLILTASQMFIACNTPRVQAGLDAVLDSPILAGQPVTPTFEPPATLVIDDPDVTLTVPVRVRDSGAGDFLFYVSDPQSPSTKFFKGPFKLASVIAAVPTSEQDFVLEAAVLPPIAEGQVLWFRFRETLDDGRLSAASIGSVVATEAP